ncbi:MAG: septum formation protein Maf [Bacteroidales bacterium 36-12]|nr:MAG: septum formation protein Maf [Bacteroidales bacterium 36-12]
MLDNLKKYNIILGSASPRRQELLRGINIDFEVLPLSVDEDYPTNLNPHDIPEYLAVKKSDAYLKLPLSDNTLIITADTIVIIDNNILGKPTDKEEAKAMLRKLSDRTHDVITGVCIRTKTNRKIFKVVSSVRFSHISDAEIDYYLDKYAPYDKAGSYGVQEWIGYVAVEDIQGSYFNVMGLPIQRLYHELKSW